LISARAGYFFNHPARNPARGKQARRPAQLNARHRRAGAMAAVQARMYSYVLLEPADRSSPAPSAAHVDQPKGSRASGLVASASATVGTRASDQRHGGGSSNVDATSWRTTPQSISRESVRDAVKPADAPALPSDRATAMARRCGRRPGVNTGHSARCDRPRGIEPRTADVPPSSRARDVDVIEAGRAIISRLDERLRLASRIASAGTLDVRSSR
jgi:hypothetical protein